MARKRRWRPRTTYKVDREYEQQGYLIVAAWVFGLLLLNALLGMLAM